MKNQHPAAATDLDGLPGHYIRRLQQIAVAIFLEETDECSITPVQFAAMQTVFDTPGIDQRTLAATIGFDTSTIGGVIDRLEARGLIERHPSPTDRRVRQLKLTTTGRELLGRITPLVARAQARILAPLPAPEREQFLLSLRKLVLANNTLSRAPGKHEK
ncbi:MAG: MarR family winged helix-turn-helix transcriptional regulator [Burkholderiaceae bacterium]